MFDYLQNISKKILKLSKFYKRFLVVITDIFLCFFSVWFAFYLRLDKFLHIQNEVLWASLISVILAIPIFFVFNLYRTIFRHSGFEIVSSVFPAFSIYSILYFLSISIFGVFELGKTIGIPRTVGIIQPFLFFFIFISSRLVASYLLIDLFENSKNNKNRPIALIYGAGNSGSQLVKSLNKNKEIEVVGFLDDDINLSGRVLNGIKIFSPLEIKSLVVSKKVTHILLALPSAKRNERLKIINKINQSKINVSIKTLPSLLDIVEGKVAISDIRDLDIDDILGRNQVEPDIKLLSKNTTNKKILITGAGGSIGQEICRQIIKLKPSTIILFDNNEYSLYSIHSEIENMISKLNIENVILIPLLGSVQDKNLILNIMNNLKPDTVYHVAAYKHVPMVEHNVIEGIKNNLFGTINTFESAVKSNVSDFVLVSTDKAVRPTNIMGASKRLAELCVQGINKDKINSKLKLSIVRFGNVIDSSGSVIPKFRKQIQNGGPVTLTHKDVTRYFMTIPEAAQLVIQAGAISDGNDLFVLDMGKPVKISDLLQKIIKLSGLIVKDEKKPDGDIEIKIIGLRPGEKLYEELLLGKNPIQTSHTKILKAQDPFFNWDSIRNDIDELKLSIKNNNIQKIIEIIKKLVTGFEPSSKILKVSEENLKNSNDLDLKNNN